MSPRDHYPTQLYFASLLTLIRFVSPARLSVFWSGCVAPLPSGRLKCTSQVGSRLPRSLPTRGKFFQLDLSTFLPRLIAITLCRPPQADAVTSACLSGAGMASAPHPPNHHHPLCCKIRIPSSLDCAGSTTASAASSVLHIYCCYLRERLINHLWKNCLCHQTPTLM